MELTSTEFSQGEDIPEVYTCEGDDINPPLSITNVPDDAVSLALIMEDPDAPDGTFTHWMVWNIDPETEEIDEGEIPDGSIQGTNDAHKVSYSGPCPPTGAQHHYTFKLFALDLEINLPETTTRDNFEDEISGHILSQASLTGTYGREELE